MLHKLILENEHLPKQGSLIWKKSRLSTIGGSEIATILKKNKYSSILNLIKTKKHVHTTLNRVWAFKYLILFSR